MRQASVINAVVRIVEPPEHVFGFGVAVVGRAVKLVADGQPEDAQRVLIFRFHRQHVFADGFCLLRLVQQPVKLGLGVGLADARLRNGFELVFHGAGLLQQMIKKSKANTQPRWFPPAPFRSSRQIPIRSSV